VDDAAAAHTLVSRALKEGTKEDAGPYSEKAVAQYGATSDPAKRVKELGAPDEIRSMTMGDTPWETWLWYGKKKAILFSKGKTVTSADWNTVAVAQAETGKAPTSKKTR
jgi:hypothetical protein